MPWLYRPNGRIKMGGNRQTAEIQGLRQNPSLTPNPRIHGKMIMGPMMKRVQNCSTSSAKASRTGKELVPEYDGVGPLRDCSYLRCLPISMRSTAARSSWRGSPELHGLGGCKDFVKASDGVQPVLNYFYQELEPLEFFRNFLLDVGRLLQQLQASSWPGVHSFCHQLPRPAAKAGGDWCLPEWKAF